MRRKLIPSGTGWALYMPKDVLKLLGYNPANTSVILKMNKNILEISRIMADKVNNDYLIKKFNKSGSGYKLYISNSIIQFLEVNPETDEVKYTIEDNILYISKATNSL